MDRRQRRTKERIRKAFVEMIAEVGLKNITVSGLSKKADINRGTFYLHYEDIDDLLDALQEELIYALKQVTQQIDPNEIIEDQEKLYPLLIQIIQSFAEHADLITVLIGPQGDPSFLMTWEQIVANLVFRKMGEVPEEDQITPIPPNYLATIVSSIYTGVVMEWIDKGMKEEPEEIARIISRFAIQPILTDLRKQEKNDTA